MSNNDLTVSNGEQGEAEPDSVFDFLYHDGRRIGSFLSQFNANGLLTGITQADGVTKGAKRSKKIGFGAQAPVLGGGNLEFEIGPGETGSQTMERAYDPFWANARVICPPLSGPATMIVWTTKGTLNAEQEAHAGRDYRQAA